MTRESTSLLERKTVFFSGIPRTHKVAFTEEGGTTPCSSRSSLIAHPCPAAETISVSALWAPAVWLFVAFHQHFTQRQPRMTNLTTLEESDASSRKPRHTPKQARRRRRKEKWEAGTLVRRGSGNLHSARTRRLWTWVGGGVATRRPCLLPAVGFLTDFHLFRFLEF